MTMINQRQLKINKTTMENHKEEVITEDIRVEEEKKTMKDIMERENPIKNQVLNQNTKKLRKQRQEMNHLRLNLAINNLKLDNLKDNK